MVGFASETVEAQPRGLELFAPPSRGMPLWGTGTNRPALKKLGIENVQDLLQH